MPPVDRSASAFHASLAGYEPTPVHSLRDIAADLGIGAVFVKNESNRLGLPAFKILGASWAVERTLQERSDVETLVAHEAGGAATAPAFSINRPSRIVCAMSFDSSRYQLPSSNSIAG